MIKLVCLQVLELEPLHLPMLAQRYHSINLNYSNVKIKVNKDISSRQENYPNTSK